MGKKKKKEKGICSYCLLEVVANQAFPLQREHAW